MKYRHNATAGLALLLKKGLFEGSPCFQQVIVCTILTITCCISHFGFSPAAFCLAVPRLPSVHAVILPSLDLLLLLPSVLVNGRPAKLLSCVVLHSCLHFSKYLIQTVFLELEVVKIWMQRFQNLWGISESPSRSSAFSCSWTSGPGVTYMRFAAQVNGFCCTSHFLTSPVMDRIPFSFTRHVSARRFFGMQFHWSLSLFISDTVHFCYDTVLTATVIFSSSFPVHHYWHCYNCSTFIHWFLTARLEISRCEALLYYSLCDQN